MVPTGVYPRTALTSDCFELQPEPFPELQGGLKRSATGFQKYVHSWPSGIFPGKAHAYNPQLEWGSDTSLLRN